MKKGFLIFAVLLFFGLMLSQAINAQTTVFTYQGSLNSGGAPANGNFDFEFAVFNSGNQQFGSIITLTNVAVVNGIFSVNLNFGDQFQDADRLLEIRVRPAGGGAFTVLGPRQPITSAPYSIKSLNATNALQLGGVPASQYLQSGAGIITAGTQFNIGGNRVLIAGGTSNTFLGFGAGTANAGAFNSFFGSNAGLSNTSGNFNNFFGSRAGQANTTGSNNNFFGTNAGADNTTGVNNSFFGNAAGGANTTGVGNAFFGAAAGVLNTTASANSFFGANSGASNTTGAGNSFFGNAAGIENTTAGLNSFFGASSGLNTTTGGGNSFFGNSAGLSNTTGAGNSFLGSRAGFNNSIGTENSFFGLDAGFTNTFGNRNSFFGARAGGADGLSNATAIGNRAFVEQNNSLVLGSINGVNGATADTNVGIGTTTPTERLDIRANGANIIFGGGGCPAGSVAVGLNGAFGNCTNYSVRGDGSNLLVNRPAGGEILFRENNGSTQVRIRAGGALAVNSNGGTVLLGDAGCGTGFTGIGFAANFGACNNYSLLGNGTDTMVSRPAGGLLAFREGNTTQMFIAPGGFVGIQTLGAAGSTALCRNASNQISTCSSSIRYKSNVKKFSSGLNLIKKLRPVSFDWKDGGLRDMGLVAEEVAAVEPLLTTTNDKGETEGVKYDRVGVVLVNAVQEQQTQIEILEKKVDEQAEIIRRQQAALDALKQFICSNNPAAELCKKPN